jgi:hypothetical protein
MPTVEERRKELAQKRAELGAIFQQYRVDGEGERATYDMPRAVLAEVRGRNDELERLTAEWEEAVEAEEVAARLEAAEARSAAAERRIDRKMAEGAAREGAARLGQGVPRRFPMGGDPLRDGGCRKTLGELVMESKAVAGYQGGTGPAASIDVDLKTLMSTSAGWDPEDTRTGKVVLAALQQPRVIDLIPKTVTRQSTVLYMEETTHTNNAAEVAEGGTYGESAFAYTEKNSEVRKIGVSLPVTDEMLEDTERLAGLIDERLRFQLAKRLDTQILVGNGTTPNLRGVNSLVGINTQAKGTDPVFDAIYKGIVLCKTVGFEDPDGIVMHPADWQDLRLMRTADGVYILGNPADETVPRLFGLPVVLTTHQTQNTAVVGAWRMHSELSLRRGLEVQMSDSHSTFFVEGKRMLRADLRVALIFDRAVAFCTVTGI